MSDVVVTVPKTFRYDGKTGMAAWLAEGDVPGETWDDDYYTFTTFGFRPDIQVGERVYVVCETMLVGYAPLISLWTPDGAKPPCKIGFVSGGGAVACTINERRTGFRGWRYRWWDYADERPLDLSPWLEPIARAGTHKGN